MANSNKQTWTTPDLHLNSDEHNIWYQYYRRNEENISLAQLIFFPAYYYTMKKRYSRDMRQ